MLLVVSSGAVAAPFFVIFPFGSPHLLFAAPQFSWFEPPLFEVSPLEVGAVLGAEAGSGAGVEVGVGAVVGAGIGAEIEVVAGFRRLVSPAFVCLLFPASLLSIPLVVLLL